MSQSDYNGFAFRVWDNKKKRWSHRNHFIDQRGDLFVQSAFHGLGFLDRKRCIPVFYIEQEDLNDKKVFEGDILQFPDDEFGLGLRHVAKMGVTYEPGFTIIGNIYETPELI